MLELIQHSGLVGLVIVLIAIFCIVLIAKAFLRKPAAEDVLRTRRALIFWGVLAAFLGFIGHTVGIYSALGVILEMETVSAADVSSALRISLGPVLLGLGVLVIAGAGWFGLRFTTPTA